MCIKYIEFTENQIGEDGYKYYKGVKYGISKETTDAFYIAGKQNSLNKFRISKIKNKYKIREVINN